MTERWFVFYSPSTYVLIEPLTTDKSHRLLSTTYRHPLSHPTNYSDTSQVVSSVKCRQHARLPRLWGWGVRTGRQEREKKIKVPRGVTTPQDHSKTQSSSTHPPFCTVSQTEPCLGNEMRRDEVRLNDRPDDLSQRMSLTQRINCVVRVLIQDSVAISRIHVNYNIGSSQVKQRISSKNFSKVNNNKSLLNRSITPHHRARQRWRREFTMCKWLLLFHRGHSDPSSFQSNPFPYNLVVVVDSSRRFLYENSQQKGPARLVTHPIL